MLNPSGRMGCQKECLPKTLHGEEGGRAISAGETALSPPKFPAWLLRHEPGCSHTRVLVPGDLRAAAGQCQSGMEGAQASAGETP